MDIINNKDWDYLPEINSGDRYLIKEKIYRIKDIKITNIISNKEYIVAALFIEKNGVGFSENIENIINNPLFKKL